MLNQETWHLMDLALAASLKAEADTAWARLNDDKCPGKKKKKRIASVHEICPNLSIEFHKKIKNKI